MSSLNQFVFAGEVCSNPVIKPAGDSQACSLSVMINCFGKDNPTIRMPVVIFGKRATACHENIKQGNYVLVEGIVTLEEYTNSANEACKAARVRASQVHYLNDSHKQPTGATTNINLLTLTGRLGQDPVLRPVGQDQVCNFSLAVNYFDKGSEQVIFYPVQVWGNRATSCERYLYKGSQVVVEAEALPEIYTSKNGVKNTLIKARASKIHFIGSKGDSDSQGSYNKSSQYESARPVNKVQNNEIPEEDIPF